jgi:hypothetical protein
MPPLEGPAPMVAEVPLVQQRPPAMIDPTSPHRPPIVLVYVGSVLELAERVPETGVREIVFVPSGFGEWLELE